MDLSFKNEEYNIIICMNVTKWFNIINIRIHVHYGDIGLKKFFKFKYFNL